MFLSDGTATFDLPDAGFGPVSADAVQRSFLTTIAFGCGHVMSVEETILAVSGAAVIIDEVLREASVMRDGVCAGLQVCELGLVLLANQLFGRDSREMLATARINR